jgi:hypothetical protein
MECAMHATGRYPDWWKGRRFDKPTIGWGAGTTNETTRDTVQRVGRPGPASRARPPFRSVRAAGRQNITRLWWLDTRPMALDYPNLTPLPPWTKPFASSRIAAITSFVPCPKAYEGGTWDIAKNKSALQGVVPAEPSPATFRRILSLSPSKPQPLPTACPASGSISARSC